MARAWYEQNIVKEGSKENDHLNMIIGLLIVIVIGYLIWNFFNRDHNNQDREEVKIYQICHLDNCETTEHYFLSDRKPCVEFTPENKDRKVIVCGDLKIERVR